MSVRLSRLLVIATSLSAGGLVLAIDGCGTDNGDPPSAPTSDAPSGKDASNEGDDDDSSTGDDAGTDAHALPDSGTETDAGSCSKGKIKPATGETCVGFGKGTPCDVACGEYGYVCFNGGPPGFTDCREINDNGSFGSTYCCAQNRCVPQPDQDGMCTTAGKTHRYQCPPDGLGGNVTPPAGCVDGGSGGSQVERFYCCP